MKTLNQQEVYTAIQNSMISHPRKYLSMYSSIFGGIVTDPALMLVPLDDHMVHRGDAVFEALRCIEGFIYDADAHLSRLERSANGISLDLPVSLAQIKQILIETVRASGASNGSIRIFVSRGPGDFSPNPYSTIGSQLYVVYTAPSPYREALYSEGCTVGLSTHKAKPRPYCSIKSCNYLVNVLMKKEAVDRGLDFVIATTLEGEVTESSTENVAIVTRDKTLVAPPFDDMLRGTTLERILALSSEHAKSLGLKGAEQRSLRPNDFEEAESALIIGTTMGIMPVKSFETTTYTAPKDLSWLKLLSELFKHDTFSNESRRTATDL
jgi:4-amino-4-deoxychorismate lyase